MGEARRRAQRLSALIETTTPAPGQPRELSPGEAARLLSECGHLVIIASSDEMTNNRRLLDALARAYGADLGFICVFPKYDPDQPRPIWRLYDPGLSGRHYPPLLVGFLPDTPEHRAMIDVIALAITAQSGKLPAGEHVQPTGRHHFH